MNDLYLYIAGQPPMYAHGIPRGRDRDKVRNKKRSTGEVSPR
jgi:hypothetical protein